MSKKTKTKHAEPPRRSFLQRMFEPVDIASTVYFRLGFGAIMIWEVWRAYDLGWVEKYWAHGKFHFTYFGFDWVSPLPGDGMYWHLIVLGILAFFVMVGFFYRISAALFFVGFTYTFLLEQARYLNHLYFVCLVSFLMIFIPAHRAFSVDAWRRKSLGSDTIPAWGLWLLRAQMGFVYFFGGIAKINGDWLRGEPLREWLAGRSDFPIIGQLFTEVWMVYIFAYGGLLLDLFVAPLMLWRKTRLTAFCFALGFHLTNSRLFGIGIFPWFSIAATAIFFEPDWPRKRLQFFRLARPAPVSLNSKKKKKAESEAEEGGLTFRQRVTVTCLAVYVALQIFIPLRHLLYPGNVSWTEEGHNFAWHMKLRDKDAKARFYLTDSVQEKPWEVDATDYLERRQIVKMASRPDMIHQFSLFLAEEYRKKGHEKVEVRVNVRASLNGRKDQLLIDPTVDLAAQPRTLWPPADWILPLREPLQPRTFKREKIAENLDVDEP